MKVVVMRRRAQVSGITNLPDQTDIMVTISEAGGRLRGQTKTRVVRGRFHTVLIGPSSGLTDGKYVADVMTPIAAVQPDSVREIIGKKGERLKGKLVKRGGLGTTVEAKKVFYVGSDERTARRASAKRSRRERATVRRIYRGLRSLLAKGKAMGRIRRSRSLADARLCGKLMRNYQPKAKVFESEAKLLDIKWRMTLGVAANHMYFCVSCSARSAKTHCTLVEQGLREVKRAMK